MTSARVSAGALGGALALVAVLGPAAPSPAQKAAMWGTVQGTIVWGEKEIPKRREIKPPGLPAACLLRGALLDPEFVINPKNRGLQDTMVWLIRADRSTKAPPIHPALVKPVPKVEIDQPCCLFEPLVLGMREGQVLVAKNSSPISHNVNILGGDLNPKLNRVIEAGRSLEVPGWKVAPNPVPVGCNIHPWMRGYIRVFDHPYFAVTDKDGKFTLKDAPAGRYRLVVWHPGIGWGTGDGKEPDRYGKVIEIKGGAATTLPAIAVERPRD